MQLMIITSDVILTQDVSPGISKITTNRASSWSDH